MKVLKTHLDCSEGSRRLRLLGGCLTKSSAMFLRGEAQQGGEVEVSYYATAP